MYILGNLKETPDPATTIDTNQVVLWDLLTNTGVTLTSPHHRLGAFKHVVIITGILGGARD